MVSVKQNVQKMAAFVAKISSKINVALSLLSLSLKNW